MRLLRLRRLVLVLSRNLRSISLHVRRRLTMRSIQLVQIHNVASWWLLLSLHELRRLLLARLLMIV